MSEFVCLSVKPTRITKLLARCYEILGFDVSGLLRPIIKNLLNMAKNVVIIPPEHIYDHFIYYLTNLSLVAHLRFNIFRVTIIAPYVG